MIRPKKEVSVNVISPAVIVSAIFFIGICTFAWAANRSQVKMPASGLPASQRGPMQKITPEERDFLVKLGQNIKNDQAAGMIRAIIGKLDNSPRLEQTDYDFLTDLSRRINNQAIAGMLVQISQKHRP